MNSLIWFSVPLAPLVMGAVLMRWRRQAPFWIWLASIPALACALWPIEPLALGFLWPGASWGAIDPLARALLGFTALLWGAASLFGASTQQDDVSALRFWLFWLPAFTGNLLLIIARDSISFYVGFSVMSLAAYGLVAHLPGAEPRRGGRIYLQLAILGEMLLYAGLMLRLQETDGALQFSAWRTTAIEPLTALLLFLGLGLKAGFWPLHLWLPRAHPVAPAAASAVLSGAMLKAGILGLWRFFPDTAPLLSDWSTGLIAMGLFSAFYGALLGLLHTKAKVVLAYSSISQMGYLLAIVALAWHQPEQRVSWELLLALYAVHHGLAKGALFLGAGLAGKQALNRPLWWLLTLPALALAALPLTSGAAVKTQLKTLLETTDYQDWNIIFTLATLTTALLVMRALWLIKPESNSKGENATQPKIPFWSCSLLCLAAPLGPWLWPAMRTPFWYSLEPKNLGLLLWPIILAGILSWWVIQIKPHLRPVFGKGFISRREMDSKLTYLVKLGSRFEAPSAAHLKPPPNQIQRWRSQERRWNRTWQDQTVTLSAWLIIALLLLGWLWQIH